MIMNALGKKQRAPPSLLCGKTFLGRVNTKTAPIVLTDDQGDDADDHDDLDDDHDHHDDYLNDDHDDNQVFLMTEFGDDNVAYHSITFFFASIFVTQILRHFNQSPINQNQFNSMHHAHFFRTFVQMLVHQISP